MLKQILMIPEKVRRCISLQSWRKNKDHKVLVVEPKIVKLPQKMSDAGIDLVSIEEAIERANTIAILVDHDEFNGLNKQVLNAKVIIDTRGVVR